MLELYYVEDDPDIASAVKEYLGQKGCRVIIGSTLAQAQRDLEAQTPACVLLDWNMPDGRGDRLCRWIRSRWRELPVIFLTVRGDAADIVSGFQNGADDYVVKPFALEVPQDGKCTAAVSVLRRDSDGPFPKSGILRAGSEGQRSCIHTGGQPGRDTSERGGI